MEGELELQGFTPAQVSEILEAVDHGKEGLITQAEMLKKIAKVVGANGFFDIEGNLIPLE